MFEEIIKHYPDFPKPGIDFIDVLPFLHDKQAFNKAVGEIDRLATAPNLATVEARGFLFGAPLLAVSDHVQTLVPFRKNQSENQQMALSFAFNSAINEVFKTSIRSWKKVVQLYVLENIDDPSDTRELSGSQLMKNGITVPITQTRVALIYHYRLK